MDKTKEEMTPVEKLWDEYSTSIPEDAYGGAEEIAEEVAGKEIMYESDFKSAFEQYSLQSTNLLLEERKLDHEEVIKQRDAITELKKQLFTLEQSTKEKEERIAELLKTLLMLNEGLTDGLTIEANDPMHNVIKDQIKKTVLNKIS